MLDWPGWREEAVPDNTEAQDTDRIFEIRVFDVGLGNYRIEAGVAGEPKEQEEIKLTKPRRFDEQLRRIQEALLLAPITRDGAEDPGAVQPAEPLGGTLNVIQELGEELFDLLFSTQE
jgi:hypothetical protein